MNTLDLLFMQFHDFSPPSWPYLHTYNSEKQLLFHLYLLRFLLHIPVYCMDTWGGECVWSTLLTVF